MTVVADLRPSTSQRFEVLPTIDGFEVICADTGRAVAKRSTRASATGTMTRYNSMAAAGTGRLAVAWKGSI